MVQSSSPLSFHCFLSPLSVQTSEAWENREENSEHNSFILENVSFPQKGARKAFFISRGLLLSTPPALILLPSFCKRRKILRPFPPSPSFSSSCSSKCLEGKGACAHSAFPHLFPKKEKKYTESSSAAAQKGGRGNGGARAGFLFLLLLLLFILSFPA